MGKILRSNHAAAPFAWRRRSSGPRRGSPARYWGRTGQACVTTHRRSASRERSCALICPPLPGSIRRGAGARPGGTCFSSRRGIERRSIWSVYVDSGGPRASLARKKRRTGPDAGEDQRLKAESSMHVVSFDSRSDVTSCGRHIRVFSVIVELLWSSSRAGPSLLPTW